MITAASTEELERLLAQPGPLWVFKHSQTCGISQEAHAQVDGYAEAHPDQPVLMVTVQGQRPLSNWISTRFATTHQSPQLFLVRGGRPVWNASHWQITRAAMEAAIARPAP
jgi:bacillithiol system protein YtxJ